MLVTLEITRVNMESVLYVYSNTSKIWCFRWYNY